LTIKIIKLLFERTPPKHMPQKLMNRASFDACISSIIDQKKRNQAEITKLKRETDQLERCEAFLRGLMRTHTHLPKDDDSRPQFFMFSKKTRKPSLVRGFMAPETEGLMPQMPRIPREETMMQKMSGGQTGFVVGVYPFNDYFTGHSKFVVDFQTWTAEPFKK